MALAKGNDPGFLKFGANNSHFYSYGFARYESVEQAEDCIRGLVSLKYEAGFARVCGRYAISAPSLTLLIILLGIF